MQRTILAAAVGFGTVLLVVGTLSGCAAKTPSNSSASSNSSAAKSHAGSDIQSPAHPATPHVTPTPTPAGPPPLPANALFQISATVKAGNGATAELIQTVFKPATQNASDIALLSSQCNFDGQPDWQSLYPNSLFLDTTITATLHPASPAFLPDDQVNFDFAWGASAYSGAYSGFEAACSPGYIDIPGTLHGVATVPSSDPVRATYGWANNPSGYGFWAGGNVPGSPDAGGTAVVSNCVTQLGPDATAAGSVEAAWATQPFTMVDGCSYEA